MKNLLTNQQEIQLIKNWKENKNNESTVDHFPVVKFYLKKLVGNVGNRNMTAHLFDNDELDFIDSNFEVHKLATNICWVLSEYNPHDELFFGVADLGLGCPEMGYVSVYEFEQLGGSMLVVNDEDFIATDPISIYAQKAYSLQSLNLAVEALRLQVEHENHMQKLQNGENIIPFPENN